MPRPDPAKERYWRAMIADCNASGLSRAEYCRQKGISVLCLRNWITRLALRDARTAKAEVPRQAETKKARVQKDKRIKGKAVTHKTRYAAPAAPDNHQRSVEFAEIQVVNSQKVVAAALEQSGSYCLEIVFGSGIKLHLASGCPLDLLSSVITLLENR
jgi:hypothetical protein